jgi:hypothetical protein
LCIHLACEHIYSRRIKPNLAIHVTHTHIDRKPTSAGPRAPQLRSLHTPQPHTTTHPPQIFLNRAVRAETVQILLSVVSSPRQSRAVARSRHTPRTRLAGRTLCSRHIQGSRVSPYVATSTHQSKRAGGAADAHAASAPLRAQTLSERWPWSDRDVIGRKPRGRDES